jgi:hypothetical protein
MTPAGISQRRVGEVLERETGRSAELRPRGMRHLEVLDEFLGEVAG